MTIETLKALRLVGRVPGFVWVLVGPSRGLVEDSVMQVEILESDYPERMDFRPLVGLHVDLIETGPASPLFLRTWDALESAKAKVGGLVRSDEVMGLSEDHENCLRKLQKILFR